MEHLIFYDYATVSGLDTLAFGQVAPRSSDDTALRITNDSDSYQALDITVTITGTDAAQLYLSLDGDVFTTSIEVGDIPPNAMSAPFWLRRVTPSSTASGTSCSASLIATPTGWANPVDPSTPDDALPTSDDA